jgi:hypothetical protein
MVGEGQEAGILNPPTIFAYTISCRNVITGVSRVVSGITAPPTEVMTRNWLGENEDTCPQVAAVPRVTTSALA